MYNKKSLVQNLSAIFKKALIRSNIVLLLVSLYLHISISPAYAYYTNMNASVVVGQENFTDSSSGTTASKLNNPQGVFVDVKGRLIVADTSNSRVLIWNTVPTNNSTPADLVLGQADFTSGSGNRGGSRAANTLYWPRVVYSNGDKLFVIDLVNHRLLIWNEFPTTNGQDADVVVGNSSMTASETTCDQSTMNQPFAVAVYNNRLVVTDSVHDRILIWNTIPTTNGAPANVVLGQEDFTTCSAVTASQRTITLGSSISIDSSGKLFVTDNVSNRIMIWNSIPTKNYQLADIVVGQSDFTSSSSGASASQFNNPDGVFSDGERMFVVDRGNHRLLIYNSIPTTNGESADIVLGQQDFISSSTNGSGSVSASGFNNPYFVFVNNKKMLVSDYTNHRVLIFKNTVSNPTLGISSISGLSSNKEEDAGKLRILGSIRIDGGNYNIWKVESSVNGGDYTPATSLSNSVATDSTHDPTKTDSVSSIFSHTFEPWNFKGQPTGNGDKQDWIDKQQEMLDTLGYTIKIKGSNNNTDSGNPLFYFTPFTITSPSNTQTTQTTLSLGVTIQSTQTKQDLPVISTTPEITFSVNKQRDELKEYLSHYEVWIKKLRTKNEELKTEENEWEKYITNIPVDYDLVKDNEDNILRGTVQYAKDTQEQNILLDPEKGNGRYENEDIIVTFEKSSSKITIKRKQKTKHTIDTLVSGVYQLKITAVDKHQHTQDTETVIAMVQ